MFKKILKITIIVCLCIAVLATVILLGINFYIKGKTDDRIISAERAKKLDDIDCILILGAGVRADGTPSLMLSDRLEAGISLYEKGVSPKILMSGDHGTKGYDEVNTMKNIALNDYSVPSEDIFMDHAGFSTYDSMYRAKEIFQADKIIIVTQDFHLPRALYIAGELGIEAYGVSASLREYTGLWLNELREVPARSKDYFMTLFNVDPVCLGEVIPISGDGNLTND
ncbi:MAG: SanA protein [Ruminococcaceae bacterium]|nr:SanA protein [Oscillospiraceae bacterium]